MSPHRTFAALVTLCRIASCGLADAQSVHPRFPVTDGYVNSLAIAGNTLYVGGSFNLIGTPTGSGTSVDSTRGDVAAAFPEVHGYVYTSIADGHGGWYIGGAFDRVGDRVRTNVARIRADLTVDDWNPGANGTVAALATDGHTVFAGGGFTMVAAQSRIHFAALDAVTGACRPWSADANAIVRALAVAGGRVYAGGDFTSVGGQEHHRLAAIDAGNGRLIDAWSPDLDGPVLCLDTDDGILYAGGDFMHVGGVARYRIAAFDLESGAITGWNATANGAVRAIAVSGGKVYAGGDFTHIGGKDRNYIAAVGKRWYQAVDWDPGANATVFSLRVSGDRVYAGGEFSNVGGGSGYRIIALPPAPPAPPPATSPTPRFRAAALDTTIGAPAPWYPRLDGPVFSVSVSGDRVFLGGEFACAGGLLRHGLAAIDRTTERVTAWDPNVTGYMNVLVRREGAIWVGGTIWTASGAYTAIATIDSATATVTPWNRPFDIVHSIEFGDTSIYVGTGSRDAIGRVTSAPRSGTGSNSWYERVGRYPYYTSPTPVGASEVDALASAGSHLFVGGDFEYLESTYCHHASLAMVDGATGSVLRTYPDSWFRRCLAMRIDGNRVYAAGDRLGAFDAPTGDPLPWPQPNIQVWGARALTSVPGKVIVGGEVITVNGHPSRLMAIDPVSGAALDWAPVLDNAVYALASAGGVVYAGGGFTTVGGVPHGHLAAIEANAPPVTAVPHTSRAAIDLITATPNPFASSTTVRLDVRRAGLAALDLVDISGRRVREIVPRQLMNAGAYSATLRRDGLAAGIYWLRLTTAGTTATRRIVLLP